MVKGVLGKKIGMTQLFSEKNTVVPVTVIDLDHWFVVGFKTKDKDGYDAIQAGWLRPKYHDKEFSTDWLKKCKTYFMDIKEIRLDNPEGFELGKPVDFFSMLTVGEKVHVRGTTKGYGFQGVIKRHDFRGGTASHGPRFGRWPGSMGFMRSQGRVIKGKKLPGHMGCVQRVMRQLEVIKIEPESKVALIKGSVPGGTGSLVFMQKA
jgi:large subunit ribosomal protein L3